MHPKFGLGVGLREKVVEDEFSTFPNVIWILGFQPLSSPIVLFYSFLGSSQLYVCGDVLIFTSFIQVNIYKLKNEISLRGLYWRMFVTTFDFLDL